MSTDDEAKYIQIRISPNQKQKWREYAENNGYGTLSNLIRLAVENEISDEWILKRDRDAGAEVDFDPVREDIRELADAVTYMQSQLDDLETPPTAGHGKYLSESEIMGLANRCYDVIPVARNEHDVDVIANTTHEIEDFPRATLSGTAEDVADHLGEDVYTVRQALIWLEKEQFERVKSYIDDAGIRRWYVQDETIAVDDYPDEILSEIPVPEFKSGTEY